MQKRLSSFQTLFWDFDGVIKDSVAVKTEAFCELFSQYGTEVVQKVREHHEANGGISRFEKIPYYFESFVAIKRTPAELQSDFEAFRCLVQQKVIESPWVAGVENYLRQNPYKQNFFLVTGTPQEEIEVILKALNLTPCFKKIYGSPCKKYDALAEILTLYKIPPENALMIGDAMTDYEAALRNKLAFLLRDTPENQVPFRNYEGTKIQDFLDVS